MQLAQHILWFFVALTTAVKTQQRPNLKYINIEEVVFLTWYRHAANHSMTKYSTLMTCKYTTIYKKLLKIVEWQGHVTQCYSISLFSLRNVLGNFVIKNTIYIKHCHIQSNSAYWRQERNIFSLPCLCFHATR